MSLQKAITEQKVLIEMLQNKIDNAELWIIYANAKIARGHYDLGFEKDIQNTKIQLGLLQSYLDYAEKALRYMQGVEIVKNHPIEDVMGTEILAGDVYYRITENEVVLEQNLTVYFSEFYDAEKRVAGQGVEIMEERCKCGSGGCITCPFSWGDEAQMVQNYGCLPSAYDIIQMKEKSGHNWACHGDESVICGGFVKYIKEHRPDLDYKTGNLISYETWCHKGEEAAIAEAEMRKGE